MSVVEQPNDSPEELVSAIDSGYRFAYTPSGSSFHLYDEKVLCRRSEGPDEIGPRRADKWYLKDAFGDIPEKLVLCSDCAYALREGEMMVEIIDDIRSIIDLPENKSAEHGFSKDELREIRSRLLKEGGA